MKNAYKYGDMSVPTDLLRMLHEKYLEVYGTDHIDSSAGGCTLSDILIADCPEKYFLSPKAMERLLGKLYPEDKDSDVYTSCPMGNSYRTEQAHV